MSSSWCAWPANRASRSTHTDARSGSHPPLARAQDSQYEETLLAMADTDDCATTRTAPRGCARGVTVGRPAGAEARRPASAAAALRALAEQAAHLGQPGIGVGVGGCWQASSSCARSSGAATRAVVVAAGGEATARATAVLAEPEHGARGCDSARRDRADRTAGRAARPDQRGRGSRGRPAGCPAAAVARGLRARRFSIRIITDSPGLLLVISRCSANACSRAASSAAY